mgnify:CR=1 FL=1
MMTRGLTPGVSLSPDAPGAFILKRKGIKMSAIYFLSGVLVTTGILVQTLGKGGDGWSSAVFIGVILVVAPTIYKELSKKGS